MIKCCAMRCVTKKPLAFLKPVAVVRVHQIKSSGTNIYIIVCVGSCCKIRENPMIYKQKPP